MLHALIRPPHYSLRYLSRVVPPSSEKARFTAAQRAPTARPIPAQGAALGLRHQKNGALKARPIPASIPQVSLVEFNTILSKERSELILKTLFRMMSLLRIDVCNQRVQILRANRERAITLLPFEPLQTRRLRLQQLGRRSLNLFHEIRHIARAVQPNRKVNMIGDPANAIAFRATVANHGREISKQFRAQWLVKNRDTILRTKDHMKQNECKRLCHRTDYRSGFQPSGCFAIIFPGLRPGLVWRRAFSAFQIKSPHHLSPNPCSLIPVP